MKRRWTCPHSGGQRPMRAGRHLKRKFIMGNSIRWQAYQAILPTCSHKALKAGMHGVERVHSLMRPYLARFCRRSWCFSRSVEGMVYSLKIAGGSRESILSKQSRKSNSFNFGRSLVTWSAFYLRGSRPMVFSASCLNISMNPSLSWVHISFATPIRTKNSAMQAC